MSYLGYIPRTTRQVITVPTASIASPSTTPVITQAYQIGYVDVYRNGLKLPITDFTATDGTSITLADPIVSTDEIELVVFNSLDFVAATGGGGGGGTIDLATLKADLELIFPNSASAQLVHLVFDGGTF